VIGVDALDRWLRARPGTAPVLTDGRGPEHYAVSHLPGARLAPEVENARRVVGERVERPIVVYCSVGRGAARLARALRAEGFTEVRSLEGSIFQWARHGLPPVREGEPRIGAFWARTPLMGPPGCPPETQPVSPTGPVATSSYGTPSSLEEADHLLAIG
jgi:rhodanese-related sulfurtransferase